MPRTRLAACALLFGVAVALPGCASPSSDYLRQSADGSTGTLEVAWVELAPPPGKPPVLLVNMVHVASADFYAAAQSELDRFAVVIMEGIRRSSQGLPPEGARDGAESRPMQKLDAAQALIARQLRLAAQRETIQDRDRWIHADFNESELEGRASLDDLIASAEHSRQRIYGELVRLLGELQHEHPDVSEDDLEAHIHRGPLRAVFAEQVMRGVSEHPVIVDQRNDAALAAFDRVRTEGRVAICYGASHAPGLVRGLQSRGYSVLRVRWLTVFTLERSLPRGGTHQ